MSDGYSFLDRANWVIPMDRLKCPIIPANDDDGLISIAGIVPDTFNPVLTQWDLSVIAEQIKPLIEEARGKVSFFNLRSAELAVETLTSERK